jgi:chemotaxis protein MotA
MEKSTIIGLVLGVIAVVGGMVFKGAPLGSFNNPAAIIIIIVGTFASLFVAFPMSEIKKFPTLLKLAFTGQTLIPKTDIISMFIEWLFA